MAVAPKEEQLVSRRALVAIVAVGVLVLIATPFRVAAVRADGLLSGVTGVITTSPYDDPFFLNWPAFLPALPADFTASTENECPRGSVQCVDRVVREMQRRVDGLGCAHDAAFAFLYLRTTQEYRRAVDDPAFFQDNAFVNHEDAVFADFYFRAHDSYRAGALADVPPAWRIAFSTAERRQVTAMGNALLGMNAHINRDLPFVLNAIGMVDAQGRSRKPDHDRVNVILHTVTQYVLQELAARYDPTADDGNVAFTSIDEDVLLATVQAWREQAWRNAELLRTATTLNARQAVARTIEDYAASVALGVRTAYLYGPLRTSAARDAFCAAHVAG
jgi:hypothetical protein